MRNTASIFLTIILLSTACSGDTTEGPGISGPSNSTGQQELPPTTVSGVTKSTTTLPTVELTDIEFVSALVPFTACDDLLNYLRIEASTRVGPYGLQNDPLFGRPIGFRGGPEIAMALAESAPTGGMVVEDTATPSEAPKAGVDFSGTNVQELGIDEPDLIKTDGTRIIVVEDQWLHHVDLSGSNAVLTDTVELPDQWGAELLLEDDRLLVLSQTEAYHDSSETVDSAETRLIEPGWWKPLTRITEIDISDMSNLQITNTLTLEGSYVSARVVNGSARIVITSQPEELPFVYPQNSAGEERAKEFNRQIVAETTVSDWLPSYVHEAADGTLTDGLLVDCNQVSHPTTFAGFSALSIVTVDLSEPMVAPDTTAVLANGQTVYASGAHLYVATTSYTEPQLFENEDWWEEIHKAYATSIHQFDVSDRSLTTYTGSGSVPGHVLNQFSMSEHEGHLRVATTLGAPWGFREDSESVVTVLTADTGDDLWKVGQVGDMGKGERIYSVRFVGDIAYVVTFRQTDPFYTVDLSDPSNPVVRGELKITGYSGYLHPISETLVLGIGQEATDLGRTTGTKITLFDVSNLDEPSALDTWAPGGGSSSAEWDHRAFLWWAPLNLAVLPFQDWNVGGSAAVILRVSDGKIEQIGRVDHTLGSEEREYVEPPCPVLDPDELTSDNSNDIANEILLEQGFLMLCPAESIPRMKGYWCQTMPVQEAKEYLEESELLDNVAADALLTGCLPENRQSQPPIQRTSVIDEDLWSYSHGRLQANSLEDFTRTQIVPL